MTHKGNWFIDPSGRLVRRRNRIPVSCAPCRVRKMKCNRNFPCENCTGREAPHECVYAEQKPHKKRQAPGSASKTVQRDMQARIDKLEEALRMFMSNNPQGKDPNQLGLSNNPLGLLSNETIPQSKLATHGDSMGASASIQASSAKSPREVNPEDVMQSFKRMSVCESPDVSGFNDLHWASALKDIKDARNFVNQYSLDSDAEDSEEEEEEVHEKNLDPIFNVEKVLNEDQIRHCLPPKEVLDPLIDLFLQKWPLYASLNHMPTFRKQYEQHYKDHSKTPILWIAIVLSLARRALTFYAETGHEPEYWKGRSLEESERYRDLVIQCFLVADYTRPQRYLFVAMFLSVYTNVTTRPPHYYFTMLSVVFRLALRMGYHRDPKWFPELSTFDGELRRRVWAALVQSEIWTSGKLGTPSMYNPNVMDTMLPHNLNDEDFDEHTTQLPPERPLSERTSVSTLIVTTRITLSYGLVMDHVQKVRDSSYDEVLDIDADIRAARALVPAHMRPDPIIAKQDHRMMSSFLLCWSFDCFSHRAVCLLHRRFLSSPRSDPRYAYSRKACIESAVALLDFQNLLYTNWKPPNKYFPYAKFLDDIVGTDFITAATILTLDVACSNKFSQSGDGPAQEKAVITRDEAFARLKRSYDIWYDLRQVSSFCRKSATIMGSLLGHLGHDPPNEVTPDLPSAATFAPQGDVNKLSEASPPQLSHSLRPEAFQHTAQNAPSPSSPTSPGVFHIPQLYPGANAMPTTLSATLAPNMPTTPFQVTQPQPQLYFGTNYESDTLPMQSVGNANAPMQVDPLNNFISNLQDQNSPRVVSEPDQGFNWEHWDYYLRMNTNALRRPDNTLAPQAVQPTQTLPSQSQAHSQPQSHQPQYQSQPQAQAQPQSQSQHPPLMTREDAIAYNMPFYTDGNGNIHPKDQ